MSHPVWVRGLKLRIWQPPNIPLDVAPRVGAWIETLFHWSKFHWFCCRTPCGCVD